MQKGKIDLRYIHIFGVDEKLTDGFYFRDLLINSLEYDNFVKEVDRITGSKIASKKTKEDRIEELKTIIYNVSRGAIAMNLAIKFLSYLADQGLNEILDEYWWDKMNKFKGFEDGEKSKRRNHKNW